MNWIKKSQKSQKNTFYEITSRGIYITDKYGEIRRNILVKPLRDGNLQDWENKIKMLAELKSIYDEASQNIALLDLNL